MWKHWVLIALHVLCLFWFYSNRKWNCKRKSSAKKDNSRHHVWFTLRHSTHEYIWSPRGKLTCPNRYPRGIWYVSTKNYFILLWGPFYTQLFISPTPYEPVLQKLSPSGSAHFPHLSEGPTGQDNTLYWEVIGSFQGLHVFRVIGPEDPWLLPGPEHNIRSSVSPQPGDFPSPPDQSSMKTEAHLLSLLS